MTIDRPFTIFAMAPLALTPESAYKPKVGTVDGADLDSAVQRRQRQREG